MSKPILKTLVLPNYDSIAHLGEFTNGKIYYSVRMDQIFARVDGGPISDLHVFTGSGRTLEDAKADFNLGLRRFIRTKGIHRPGNSWLIRKEVNPDRICTAEDLRHDDEGNVSPEGRR